MSDNPKPIKNSHILGSAAAKFTRRGYGCPECAGSYGRRQRGGCDVCNPPRNPPRPRPEEDL